MGDEALMIPDAPAGPETARDVFLAWERLRLVYNGLLGLEVLAVKPAVLADHTQWGYLVGSALGANVCFCAGAAAEGYLDLLGVPRRIGRWLAFGLGCVLAAGVTLASLVLGMATW